MFVAIVSYRIVSYPRRQDVKHEIKRDPRGNTTVTDLTMESVDPNDGAGVDEIMQVWTSTAHIEARTHERISSLYFSFACCSFFPPSPEQLLSFFFVLGTCVASEEGIFGRSLCQGSAFRLFLTQKDAFPFSQAHSNPARVSVRQRETRCFSMKEGTGYNL